MRKLIFTAVLLAISGIAQAATQDEAETAIQQATAAVDQADAVGYEWRDSRKMIKKAASLVKKGEYDKAVKLARQAEKQGHDAVAQSEAQKNAGPQF